MINIPITLQNINSGHCVPNALKGICDYYGIKVSLRHLIKNICRTRKRGGTFLHVASENVRQLGLSFKRIKFSYRSIKACLKKGVPIVICYVSNKNESHFSTIVGIDKRRGIEYIILADTLYGKIEYPMEVLQFLAQSDNGLWARKVVKHA